MDENIHDLVELQVANNQPITVDMTKWYPQYWFMNGRSGTDTVLPGGAAWLPNQPYEALVADPSGREGPDARDRGRPRSASVPLPRQ